MWSTPGKRYGDKVDAIQVYRNMSSFDVTICNSLSVVPLEMDDMAGQLQMKAASQSILNGATFVYLAPSEGWLTHNIDTFHYARASIQDTTRIFPPYRQYIVDELAAIHGVARKKQIVGIVAGKTL